MKTKARFDPLEKYRWKVKKKKIDCNEYETFVYDTPCERKQQKEKMEGSWRLFQIITCRQLKLKW